MFWLRRHWAAWRHLVRRFKPLVHISHVRIMASGTKSCRNTEYLYDRRIMCVKNNFYWKLFVKKNEQSHIFYTVQVLCCRPQCSLWVFPNLWHPTLCRKPSCLYGHLTIIAPLRQNRKLVGQQATFMSPDVNLMNLTHSNCSNVFGCSFDGGWLSEWSRPDDQR